MGKSKKKAKKLRISLNAHEFYAISQRQKDPAFLEKYKKRAAQEWKNGEMKRFHGLAKARGYGLKSMLTQAKLTAIAVNLKRIASIMEKTSLLFWAIINVLMDYVKTAFKNYMKCSNIVENA